MRTPHTNVWDRENQCIHFWDGRTIPGELKAGGSAWTYKPFRPLPSGVDLMIVLPLRRLQVSHHPEDQVQWHVQVIDSATHASGGLAVSDRYASMEVFRDGGYRLLNLGDLAEAAHQRIVSEAQVLHTLRALDTLCEGLHRCDGSIVELLRLWDITIAI